MGSAIKQPKGLRAIAVLEALKGMLSLCVGFALHELAGQDIRTLAESLLSHLHLNPASELPSVFMHTVDNLNDKNLMFLAIGTLFYASIRLVEAYGLWHGYAWTEWFALASGAIYLPFEIYEVVVHGKLLAVLLLALNVVVVWYMLTLILRRRAEKHSGRI